MAEESNGYEAVARQYMAKGHPHVGVPVVLEWARRLPPGARVLDLGCGPGFGISEALVHAGFALRGVDASATMVQLFRERLPDTPVMHADVLASELGENTFAAALALGLLFLLGEAEQEKLFTRVSRMLVPGGRFLFTAPWQVCTWSDVMTGQESRSLGRERYLALLREGGFALEGEAEDRGENHYWFARKV